MNNSQNNALRFCTSAGGSFHLAESRSGGDGEINLTFYEANRVYSRNPICHVEVNLALSI